MNPKPNFFNILLLDMIFHTIIATSKTHFKHQFALNILDLYISRNLNWKDHVIPHSKSVSKWICVLKAFKISLRLSSCSPFIGVLFAHRWRMFHTSESGSTQTPLLKKIVNCFSSFTDLLVFFLPAELLCAIIIRTKIDILNYHVTYFLHSFSFYQFL